MASAGVRQLLVYEHKVTGTGQVIASNEAVRRSIFGLNSATDGLNRKFLESGQRVDFLRLRLSGFREDISLLRNNLLLFVFATGGMVQILNKAVEASTKFQTALAGLSTIAFNTGNRMDDVRQAALRLTDDGLLSIAGAAEGLRNLLATGLNLKQAIDLMNVFKDAASFNRQGVLDFEEAIIRATAGVKMQQAKLIDDVGIRTRVGQMLEKQGFQLEDLTNETTKAAAVQALYLGLMKEGQFFIGDAAKLTETYAGTQARLTTQLLRTSAAFGDVLTGTRESPGIFSSSSQSLADYLKKLEDWIRANKELIGQKIKNYFETFMSAVEKLMLVFKALWTVLEPIVNFFGKGWVGPLAIAGFALVKFGTRLVHVQQKLREFAGTFGSTEGLKYEWSKLKLGKDLEKVTASFVTLRNTGVNEMKNLLTGLKPSLKSIEDLMNRPRLGKSLRNQFGDFSSYKQSLKADLLSVQNLMKDANINNVKEIERAFVGISTRYRIPVQDLQKHLKDTSSSISFLTNKVRLLNTSGGAMLSGFFSSIAAGARKAGQAFKLLIADIWPLLALEVAVGGIMWFFNRQQEDAEKLAALQDRIKNQNAERLKQDKEGIEDKLAELNKLQNLLEEYQNLSNLLGKTSTDYDRLSTIQKEASTVAEKYGVTINLVADSQNTLTDAINKTSTATEKMKKSLTTFNLNQLNTTLKSNQALLISQFKTMDKGDFKSAFEDIFKGYTTQDIGSKRGHEFFRELFPSLKDVSSMKGKFLKDGKFEEYFDVVSSKPFKEQVDIIEKLNSMLSDQLDFLEKYRKEGVFSSVEQVDALDKEIDKFTELKNLFGGDIYNNVKKLREQIEKLLNPEVPDDITPIVRGMSVAIKGLKADIDAMLLESTAFGKYSTSITKMQNEYIKRKNEIEQKAHKESNEQQPYAKEILNNLEVWKNLETEKINREYIRPYVEMLSTFGEGINTELSIIELYSKGLINTVKTLNTLEVPTNLKVLKELTEIEKLAKKGTLELAVDRFGMSQHQQKLLDAELKTRKELYDADTRIADAQTAMDVALGNKAPIMTQEQKILTAEAFLKGQKDIKTILEEIGILEKEQIIRAEEYRVKVEKLQSSYNITKEENSIKNKIKLLTVSKDAQDLYNASLEEKDALDELNQKQQALWLDIDKNLTENEYERVETLLAENESLYIKIDLWKQYFKMLAPLTAAEKALNIEIAKRNLATHEATTRTGISGAAMDILSGGQTVGLDIASIYKSYSTKANIQAEIDAYKNKGLDFDKLVADGDEAAVKLKDSQISAAEATADAWENAFSKIAGLLTSTYDLFGLKEFERSVSARENLKTELFLLEDSFKHREISAKEFSIQRDLLNKKAAIEEVKMSKLRRAEEEITFGKILEGLAIEFAVKALGALASGNFASAALYAAGATLAGSQGVALQKSGLEARAKAEAEYNRDIQLADRDAQRKLGNSGSGGSGASSNNGRSISGSITAQELKITIAPSITIQGEYINISNTGIEEASRILGDGMVNRIQEAIDNKELNLVNAVN